MVIDLDVHQGDGTATILKQEKEHLPFPCIVLQTFHLKNVKVI